MGRIKKISKIAWETMYKKRPWLPVVSLDKSLSTIPRQTRTAISKKGTETKFGGTTTFKEKGIKGRKRIIDIYGTYKRTPERHIEISHIEMTPKMSGKESSVTWNKAFEKPKGKMSITGTKGLLRSIAKQFPEAEYIKFPRKSLRPMYKTTKPGIFAKPQVEEIGQVEKRNIIDVQRLLGKRKKSRRRGRARRLYTEEVAGRRQHREDLVRVRED